MEIFSEEFKQKVDCVRVSGLKDKVCSLKGWRRFKSCSVCSTRCLQPRHELAQWILDEYFGCFLYYNDQPKGPMGGSLDFLVRCGQVSEVQLEIEKQVGVSLSHIGHHFSYGEVYVTATGEVITYEPLYVGGLWWAGKDVESGLLRLLSGQFLKPLFFKDFPISKFNFQFMIGAYEKFYEYATEPGLSGLSSYSDEDDRVIPPAPLEFATAQVTWKHPALDRE